MQRALSVSRMTGNRSTFPDWYQAVVREADLAENSPVRGAMVIKPWGYGVWEEMQRELDRRIKATGHENATSRCSSRSASSPRRPSTSRASPRRWRWSPTIG